jgi:hypothetical protein
MEWVSRKQCGQLWWCLIHYISCILRFIFLWMTLVAKGTWVLHYCKLCKLSSWHLTLHMVCNHFVCLKCCCICYAIFCIKFHNFTTLHNIAFCRKKIEIYCLFFMQFMSWVPSLIISLESFLSLFFHFVINILFECHFLKIVFILHMMYQYCIVQGTNVTKIFIFVFSFFDTNLHKMKQKD